MTHLSRSRTLIIPLFLEVFLALRHLVESRSDDASRAPRGSVVAVVAGAASGTNHIGGLDRRPWIYGLQATAPQTPSAGMATLLRKIIRNKNSRGAPTTV